MQKYEETSGRTTHGRPFCWMSWLLVIFIHWNRQFCSLLYKTWTESSKAMWFSQHISYLRSHPPRNARSHRWCLLECFEILCSSQRCSEADSIRPRDTFCSGKNQLEKGTTEWDEHRVARFLTEKQCEFIMNVPKTSHIGNVRERQIRKVRNGMSTVLALAAGRLNDVTLRTFLCKSMAIVNSHTLTGDTIDKARSIEPLTPNHFVHMKISTPLPPPGKFLKEYFYATKRWWRDQYFVE